MSNQNNIKKDYETFSSHPVKKNAEGDVSLTAINKIPSETQTEDPNFRKDNETLINLAKKHQSQQTDNFANGLSASKFSNNKQQREVEIANSQNFGGTSKEISLPEAVIDGRKGDFISQKNVVKQKNEIIFAGATQNLNLNASNAKSYNNQSNDTFSLKPKEMALAVGDEFLDATKEVIDTAKKIVTGETSNLSYAEEKEIRKTEKAEAKDNKLLARDGWLARKGHTITYVGLFLFSLVVYFRPYEWIPGFENMTSIALVFAIITLLFYLPTQLATEGNLTILTTEVKCVLFLAVWSVLTFPIAKDVGVAWKTYNEVFIKIIMVFIVMVNALRTKERLKGLMWLSIAVGVMLSYQALQLYNEGKFEVEGYRVNPDFGGMFGNPNDTALHLVIFTPVAVVLGLATKNKIAKLIYFGSATLMVMANFVMQSRGGFLGLIAISAILVWKLSKNNRLLVVGISLFIGFLVLTFAPGNYWLRIASIVDPSLDPVGSSDQRKELLIRSIQVTLRNPFGIGLGCFPIVGIRDLQTHNAFTQVSSELGWMGLAAYLIFLISPFRKLGAMERKLESNKELKWMYYLTIGLQASIIGYMVSSFFVSVAYQWFVYFPIAYAVCLRRIYKLHEETEALKGEVNNAEVEIKKDFKSGLAASQ